MCFQRFYFVLECFVDDFMRFGLFLNDFIRMLLRARGGGPYRRRRRQRPRPYESVRFSNGFMWFYVLPYDLL